MRINFGRLLLVLIGFVVAQVLIQMFLTVLGLTGVTFVILYNLILSFVAVLIYYPSEYRKYALDCLHALAEKIHVFEINTGAMARGYRTTPYPNSFILKEMNKLGLGITISSDCHDCNFLNHGFDRAVELCKACGVKELQVLTKEGFKGIALDD